eukprot:GHVS01094994.1.p1 GENE.GHVS01094994.1~~GHVS01094994.1.p1  ORF type:complete len:232 (+),score=35.28 GHVS01094994.1:181-876(+)
MVKLYLGCSFPNFQAKASSSSTTGGMLDLYKHIESNWAILFSHPADFTPVCTTELARAVELNDDFVNRRCKLIALSCNDVTSHESWSADIMAHCKRRGKPLPFPIIADETREIANMLNIIDPEEVDSKTKMPLTSRAVFFINPKKEMRSMILYPATTGRSFDEILRVLDSLQLTEQHPVATPEGWKVGGECMVVPTLKEEEAKQKLPKGFNMEEMPSGKPYMRFTPQPNKG